MLLEYRRQQRSARDLEAFTEDALRSEDEHEDA
jgi:hypothetical protein